MQTQNMYELAEHLKQLREEKKNAEQRLKEMNAVACHAKRKKLTRKTKKTLLNTTFKSVFYYL